MKQPSITSLPVAPGDDRHSRMVRYSIAMGIRMVCVVCLIFTPGWWMILPILGAFILPYFAVLYANVHGNQRGEAVEGPGGILPAAQGAPVFIVDPEDDAGPTGPAAPAGDPQ